MDRCTQLSSTSPSTRAKGEFQSTLNLAAGLLAVSSTFSTPRPASNRINSSLLLNWWRECALFYHSNEKEAHTSD